MNRMFRGAPATCAFLPLLLLAGCVTLDADPLPAPPPSGEPSQVVETWQPTVFFAPDPANGGRDTPTLFGRVYLFGPELKYPMIGEGKLVVDLYSGPIPRGATVAPLEEWQFDPVTLKRLAKRDLIGWGYSLSLPWGSYRPDLTCVQMKVRYEPAKGAPLYAESGPMALKNGDKDGGPPVVTESLKPAG